MRILLIHNPTAGGADHESEDLVAALRRHGDEIALASSKAPDLESVIRGCAPEMIIAAGGDGTVATVIRTIAGRIDVPIFVLPVGTANNIAGSLGIDRPQLDLRVVQKEWMPRAIDAAMAGDQMIVEAAGCGVFAGYMRNESGGDERPGVRKEAKSMAERVESSPLFDFRILADGEEIAGEALMIEAMLLPQLGPNLVLAPDADPADGFLDLVIVGGDERADLIRYLKSGGKRHAPALRSRRVKSARIACDAPWHFDDMSVDRRTRTVTVWAGAWRALVPGA